MSWLLSPTIPSPCSAAACDIYCWRDLGSCLILPAASSCCLPHPAACLRLFAAALGPGFSEAQPQIALGLPAWVVAAPCGSNRVTCLTCNLQSICSFAGHTLISAAGSGHVLLPALSLHTLALFVQLLDGCGNKPSLPSPLSTPPALYSSVVASALL